MLGPRTFPFTSPGGRGGGRGQHSLLGEAGWVAVLGGAGWVCVWGVNGDYVCPINARWVGAGRVGLAW